MGCVPSEQDFRDFLTTAIIPQDTILPSKVFWEPPLLRDQVNKGVCVGMGSGALKNIHEDVEGDFVDGGFSPLFIYSLCKSLDGRPNEEGTQIRIAMQVLKDIGITPEIDFPYDSYANQLTPFPIPTVSETLKTKASKYKIASYSRIPDKNVDALKQALVKAPVVAGVLVTSDFVNTEDGFVGIPNGYILGSHCILFIGFDNNLVHTYPNGQTKKGFIIFQNSWGENWGNNGLGYIAYDEICFQADNGNGFPFIFEMWSNVDLITTPQKQKYWRVQLYAFKEKSNAFLAVEKLKSQGFDTYILEKDGFWKIQIGAFSIKNNANLLAEKLKSLGYNPWVIYY